MSWIAVAIGGSALIGAITSNNASNQAASTAANAANQANQTQWGMYNQNREDQAPWRTQGTAAVNMLGAGFQPGGEFDHQFGMADYQADPGYQFRLDQGNKALQRAGAKFGNSLSGAQMQGMTDYNQGMASQEYGNAYNRFMNNRTTRFGELSNLAGLGQSSVGATGQAGQNAANQIGNNTMGAATVAGNAGMANAGNWTNALNNGVNQWQNYNAMNNMNPNAGGISYGFGGAAPIGTGQAGTDGWGY